MSLASALPSLVANEAAREPVREMARATGWKPDRIGSFAGALRYSQYDWPMQVGFKLASIPMGLGTDTSRDYEYTDWTEVEEFADEFAKFVEFDLGTDADLDAAPSERKGHRVAMLAAAGLALAAVVYWARVEWGNSRSRRPNESNERTAALPCV